MTIIAGEPKSTPLEKAKANVVSVIMSNPRLSTVLVYWKLLLKTKNTLSMTVADCLERFIVFCL